jgi:hypothetical protein
MSLEETVSVQVELAFRPASTPFNRPEAALAGGITLLSGFFSSPRRKDTAALAAEGRG